MCSSQVVRHVVMPPRVSFPTAVSVPQSQSRWSRTVIPCHLDLQLLIGHPHLCWQSSPRPHPSKQPRHFPISQAHHQPSNQARPLPSSQPQQPSNQAHPLLSSQPQHPRQPSYQGRPRPSHQGIHPPSQRPPQLRLLRVVAMRCLSLATSLHQCAKQPCSSRSSHSSSSTSGVGLKQVAALCLLKWRMTKSSLSMASLARLLPGFRLPQGATTLGSPPSWWRRCRFQGRLLQSSSSSSSSSKNPKH